MPRIRFQPKLSLRALFGLTTLAAVIFWWQASFENQRRAVAAIQSAGGSVVYQTSESKPWMFEVWLRSILPQSYFDRVLEVEAGEALTDAHIGYLQFLPRLQSLRLRSSEVTNVGVKRLANLRLNLRSLEIHSDAITNQGLESICRIKSLRSLDIRETKVDSDGMIHLASLTNLTSLNLHGLPITDDGLEPISQLKQLEDLDLSETEITTESIPKLGRMRSLQSLDILGNRIRDIKPLGGLVNLRKLSPGPVRLGKDDLESLAPLTQLESLNIFSINVSKRHIVSIAKFDLLKSLKITGSFKDPFEGNLFFLGLLEARDSEGSEEWLRTRLPKCEIRFDRGEGIPDPYPIP